MHGSVPWSTGEGHVIAATKMLEAAAKAERSKAPYFGNRHWPAARAYLDAVHMGQTEPGSYVLIAFSPVHELQVMEIPIPELAPVPTGRAVTETLWTALESTAEAIEHFNSAGSLSGFEHAVQTGASYELSQALIGLLQGSDGADVAIDWSSSTELVRPSSKVAFEPSDVNALQQASSRFARTEPASQVTVTGTVTLLDRPRPGTPGVIRLSVLDGSPARKIRVRIPEEVYDLAIQAHREGLAVRMRGRQEREGSLYWLYEPSDIELVQLPPGIQAELEATLFDELDDEG